MKKLLYTGLALILSLGVLTGCSTSKTVTFTREDKLTIATKDDRTAEIPYLETITLNVEKELVTGGSDVIEYKLTDQYFNDNPTEKEALLTNLEAGLSSVYVDKNEGSLTVNTTLKNNILTAHITTDFTKVADLKLSSELFGLDASTDFDENHKVKFETVDKTLTDAGFTKTK